MEESGRRVNEHSLGSKPNCSIRDSASGLVRDTLFQYEIFANSYLVNKAGGKDLTKHLELSIVGRK